MAAEGFNGIPVALLGMSNPIAVIFTGTFMAYLTQGGLSMQSYGFPTQIVDIMSSVIIYFSAFALFFSQTIEKLYKRSKEKRAAAAQTGKGGDGK